MSTPGAGIVTKTTIDNTTTGKIVSMVSGLTTQVSTCNAIFATRCDLTLEGEPKLVVCKLRFSYSKFAMGDIPISLLFVCLMAFVTV